MTARYQKKIRIRLQGFLILCAVISVILLPKLAFCDWKNEFFDEIFDAVGILIVLLGFLMRISARGHKKGLSQGGASLVTEGPYAATRHPMYTGTFLIGIGIVCILFNLWVLVLVLAVYVGIYVRQIKKEETLLESRFKDAYRQYVKQTPMLIPKIGAVFQMRKHYAVKREMLKSEMTSLLFVFVFILIVEGWQDNRLFGRGELLEEMVEIITFLISYFILGLFFFRPQKST